MWRSFRTTMDRTTAARRRTVTLGVAMVTGCVVLSLYSAHRHAKIHAYQPHIKPHLSYVRTTATWNQLPVYRITNHADFTLSNITIRNWSNELVPIYSIGTANGAGLPASRDPSFPPAPLSLDPGESVWIVGPADRTLPFTLYWQQDGHATFANVTAAR